MKLFTALARFLHRQPPTHPAPAQFDDGLTEIARLIAREVPVTILPESSSKDKATTN